jgi:hypothetical protein
MLIIMGSVRVLIALLVFPIYSNPWYGTVFSNSATKLLCPSVSCEKADPDKCEGTCE